MPEATYVVEIDWNDNGTFGGGDVVTADVLATNLLVVDRGVDVSAGPIPGPLATAIDFDLTNSDYTYHPANSSSPVFGDLVPGRIARVRTTAPATRSLGLGRIESFEVDPNPDRQLVHVTVFGGLATLIETPITTDVFDGIRAGEAIEAILDAAGWPASRRQLDDGVSTFPHWWADNETALDAIARVLRSEGPGAIIFENGDGDIVFHDRHHRLTDVTAATSQVTYRDTGTEPQYGIPQTYNQGFDRIRNRIIVTPLRYDVSATQVLFTDTTTRFIPPLTTTTITLPFDPALFELETPTVGYNVNDNNDIQLVGQIGVTLAPATAMSVTWTPTRGPLIAISFENTDATGTFIIARIRLRGRTFVELDPESYVVEDTASQTTYGVRTLALEDVWMTPNDATAVATLALNDYKDPQPVVTIPVSNGHATRLTDILTREVGDRVTVIDNGPGLNEDFYIERITHDVIDGGKHHRMTITASAVGTPLVTASEVLILDSATKGILDTNKLAY